MTEKKYSLCLTIIGQNNYSQLLRLADPIDIKGPTLWQLNGKINRPDLLERKTISMDPFSAQENELAIWEWELDSNDPNKQWSKRTNEIFYELIFLDNENLNRGLSIPKINLGDKIDLMVSGFKVQQFISENLLLVFDEPEKNVYYCLNLKKSGYIIEDNILRIKEGEVFDIHQIAGERCIDTNDYLENVPMNNFEMQRRIIYRERKLREPINTLRIQSFLSLFKKYLEDVTEKMSYTEAQRKLIQTTIDRSFENKEKIEDFFDLTGSKEGEFIFTPQTIKKFKEASQIITKYVSKIGIENFLESVIENTPELKESYIDLLSGDYLVEEKEKIEQDLEKLEKKKIEKTKEFELLEKSRDGIQKDHSKAKEEITKFNDKLKELEERKGQLDQYFEDRIKYIKENSGAFLGEIAVLKGITQNDTSSGQYLTIIKSEPIEFDEKILISDAEELIVELEENLYNILIQSNYDSNVLAKYIVSSYLSGLPILLIGNTSELLAETISATFCSRTPETINLPTGYSNYQDLSNSVKSSKSDVVFIKNGVGYCDEYIYLNLIKDNPDKFLLFSAEFNDTIKILPAGILGYMGIIDCEEMISPFAFDEIIPTKIEKFNTPKLEKNGYHSLYRKISKLTENSPLTKGYTLSRAKMLLTVSNVESCKNNLLEILIPEIITYNRITGTIESYIQYLQSQDNSEYYDIVKEFLGDGD